MWRHIRHRGKVCTRFVLKTTAISSNWTWRHSFNWMLFPNYILPVDFWTLYHLYAVVQGGFFISSLCCCAGWHLYIISMLLCRVASLYHLYAVVQGGISVALVLAILRVAYSYLLVLAGYSYALLCTRRLVTCCTRKGGWFFIFLCAIK